MNRKAHKKSRRGCLSCKKRRIKCDEQKPTCQKCIAHGVECIYAPPPSLKWVFGKNETLNSADANLSQNGNSSQYLSSLNTISVPSNPSLNLENINLIINWFTSTVYSVNSSSNHAALEICQTLILRKAMEHHFLLHGLLALSALHIAETHPDSKKYIQTATAHHTQGLSLFHSILSDINESNYSACIAFSSITTIFAFGISRPVAGKDVGIRFIDDLAQIFLLSKGWMKVVSVAEALNCKAGSSIEGQPAQTNVLSRDSKALFDYLIALNKTQGKETIEIYSQAIASLKVVFAKVENSPTDDPHVALEWINGLPEGFMGLMRERHQIALVLLGLYCVVLERVPQVWWLRGWCNSLFRVVWKGVKPAWRDALELPRKIIQAEV